jgi:hypothetical protein
MGLEIITLITILTLLAICLGVSFLWVVVIETAIQNIIEPIFLEVIAHIRLQATQLILVIFFLAFACGVILNVIPNSRSEPYLLKIGLISLIWSFVFVLIKFAFLEQIAIASKYSLISNVLLWFNLISLTISYWSFLHYGLNPKI